MKRSASVAIGICVAALLALTDGAPPRGLAHGNQDQSHVNDPGCTVPNFSASAPSTSMMRQEFVPSLGDLGAIDVCATLHNTNYSVQVNIRSGTAAAPGALLTSGLGAAASGGNATKYVSVELEPPISTTPGTTYVIEVFAGQMGVSFDWRATSAAGADGYPSGVSHTSGPAVGDFAFRSFEAGDTDLDGMPDMYEVANPCLDRLTFDSLDNYDFDTVNNIGEYSQGSKACDEDTDDDTFEDAPLPPAHVGSNSNHDFDTCVLAANNPQVNTDAAALPNGPLAPGDDVTIAKSDPSFDACDTDDDNDGVGDAAEVVHPVAGCPSATSAINPLDIDTDGDHLTDGWECFAGPTPTDPASGASKFNGSGSADADGDRIPDLWEMRGYNASGGSTDSDGDGCHDLVEVASVDGNMTIADPDRLSVARRALGVWTAEAAQDYALDIDKNGTVGDPDRLFVARAALLPGWLPKSCP